MSPPPIVVDQGRASVHCSHLLSCHLTRTLASPYRLCRLSVVSVLRHAPLKSRPFAATHLSGYSRFDMIIS
ncbi:hypothetical protein BRADI_5g12423v3 [Brachypodium distachyon]|uniref:Uncharacterized protein n=1 Tax=Brachypodium distachyon TaxID=15368 RepID=A0A2K2CGS2_BRADI|nr:hypothetical protein BRADI_5g12423v3 [Brachypodium distachyon]